MGKVSPSIRSMISTAALVRQSQVVSSGFLSQVERHRHFPKKPTKKSSSKLPQKTLEPELKPLFKSPNLNDAKKLFNSLIATARAPEDPRFHNSLLQSYASISSLDDSISLLQHMIKAAPSFSPDRSTYHILLSQACRAPDSSLSPVHKVLNFMVNNGVVPNQVSVDIAARSLCSVDRIDNAIELVKELSLKHSKPDAFTYNFLVKCLCKSRVLSTVHSFIDEMSSSFDIKPDLVTYTILIDNVCNSKNLREATRLVGVLKECGFKPDCFVYNTIMKGYCMLSKGSEAIGVYNEMKKEGVEPDLVTYNTLIFGLSKSGRVSEAQKFLKIMVESGHLPDIVTYTSIMNGMCREGNALGALALLEQMEGQGCTPNSCTYNTLLHGLCKGRLLDKAIELYKMMKEAAIKLETASYATLLRALCREGRVAEAYEVFDYAVASKSLTDAAAYSTLESTLKWLKKAREQGLVV
ncbi:hypothetical protein K2173_006224 [Erythroxylum novogranatense]|uniref:Pentatricopeptide repeat-containing protein n=1 Tax=Erythroxylum novogranatense TaxID=1862640 RepID=A0AAV8TDV2_9ROSI|nr:hypothetical protein K2173_006224 [Erythroxylum novogranatense]